MFVFLFYGVSVQILLQTFLLPMATCPWLNRVINFLISYFLFLFLFDQFLLFSLGDVRECRLAAEKAFGIAVGFSVCQGHRVVVLVELWFHFLLELRL